MTEVQALDVWTIVQSIGSWLSVVVAIAAVYVALYVNHDAKSPQVVAYLEHDRDHSSIRFVVANFGSGVARNVKVGGFDFSIVAENLRDKVETSFIANGISVLVPQASRSTTIVAGVDMQPYEHMIAEVKVSYDTKGFPLGTKRIEESFVLDFQSFFGSFYSTSDTHRIVLASERIERTIKELQRDNRRMASAVVNYIDAVADDE